MPYSGMPFSSLMILITTLAKDMGNSHPDCH